MKQINQKTKIAEKQLETSIKNENSQTLLYQKISNNLNVPIKQLTSISIILMIPTVIANFYGMNVPNSLQTSGYGFWLIVFISCLFSVLGVVLFKKKNWF